MSVLKFGVVRGGGSSNNEKDAGGILSVEDSFSVGDGIVLRDGGGGSGGYLSGEDVRGRRGSTGNEKIFLVYKEEEE